MAKKTAHVSETPATQALRARRRRLQRARLRLPRARRHGRVGAPARRRRARGVKTLVMQNEKAEPLIVLMHGDRQVSTKNLARAIGAKSVAPCTPEAAERASGYQVGGTSPFATRKTMPVYVESTDPRARAHLHQRRPARLPGRHRAARADRAARRDAGVVRALIGAAQNRPLMPAALAPFLPVAVRARRLPGRLALVRRDRQPRDGPERSAHLRLGQPRRDQRAALGQQGGGDPDARCSTR